MAVEYDTFVGSLDSLKEGEETALTVRDTRTYEAKRISAIIYADRQKLPHGATLWIRFLQGVLHQKPWVMEIKEEMGSPIENIT